MVFNLVLSIGILRFGPSLQPRDRSYPWPIVSVKLRIVRSRITQLSPLVVDSCLPLKQFLYRKRSNNVISFYIVFVSTRNRSSMLDY